MTCCIFDRRNIVDLLTLTEHFVVITLGLLMHQGAFD